MTIKPRGRPKADPTRDLRQELLLTSRELLAEGGPGALSMREVARRAGCTHQAPYHYFKDREVILAVLVVEGFTDLAQRLRLANQLVNTKGIKATLVASAHAYVEFAISQPGVFQIMFRPDMMSDGSMATQFPTVQMRSQHLQEVVEQFAKMLVVTTPTQ